MKYASEFARDGRVILISCIFLLSACIAGLAFNHVVTWIVLVVSIFLFWLVEYVIHRYLLHEFPKLMPKAYAGHVAHHQQPREVKYLLTPNRFNILGYVLFSIVGYVTTRNVSLTGAFVAGLSLGQLYYEWTHFVSHRPIMPKTPWGKRIKKRHLLHHYLDAEYWYGVSNSVFDRVLRTGIDDEEARLIRHRRGGDLDAEMQASQDRESVTT